MKTARMCVLCCVVAVLAGGLARAAQPVESAITAVTVYSDRALVTRTAKLAAQGAGEYEFVVEGLPRSLDDDSLRASGSGSADARLLGLDSKIIYTKETPEARVQKLRDEIQALEDQLQVLADELVVLAEQKEFITQMKLHAQQAAAQQFQFKEVNTQEWNAVVQFVGTSLGRLNQATREKNIAIRELREELEIKKKELGRVGQERVIQTKQVTVSVEVLREGTLELALDYVVPGARWAPLYDARADVLKGDVQLTYYGTVAQRTGEDWTGVKLSLSTARPAIGAQVPELEPWVLDSGWRHVDVDFGAVGGYGGGGPPGAPGREMKRKAAGIAEDSMQYYVTPELATVEERGTSAVYQVKKAETIPSDGEPHRTTIGIAELRGEMRYVIVPNVRQTAFLETEVMNTSELRLLGGPVHVFLGPDFIGRARIKGVAPGEKFKLSLGPDDRIKVKRDRQGTTVARTRNKVTVRNTVKVTVESYIAGASAIVVKEQVPISQDADVKVKLIEATDKIKANEATGELKWAFGLGHGDKRELSFQFEFSFPKEAFDYYRGVRADGRQMPAPMAGMLDIPAQ